MMAPKRYFEINWPLTECFFNFLDANLSAEDSVLENGVSNGLNENSNPLSSRSLMDEPGSIGGGDPLGTIHILRNHFLKISSKCNVEKEILSFWRKK